MTLRYLITEQTVPYDNLALEELLMQRVQPGEIILFLWQNRNTVVIGRNQNAWRECLVEQLEQDGGFLARRRSGGGAVYHDLGNLNFSFIACDDDYDLDRQFEVITAAMRKLGLAAEKSGRNDILIDGRKFSGNAFLDKNGCHCHHGTILIDADRSKLARYLSVSPEKLQSKGVASVQARVANLREFRSDLTVAHVQEALLKSFAGTYGGIPQEMDKAVFTSPKLAALRERYSSWDWRLGQPIAFTQRMFRRFSWGEIELLLQVNEGRIQAVAVFTDALNTELIDALPSALEGLPFMMDKLLGAVTQLLQADELEQHMVADICELIKAEI